MGVKSFFIVQEAPANALSLNKDFSQVVIAGRNVFKVLHIEEDRFVERLNLRIGKSLNLSFSSNDVVWNPFDETQLATAATNGQVVLWDLNKASRNKQDHVFSEHKRTCNKVTFHPSEPHVLVSGSQDGTMKLFDRTRATGIRPAPAGWPPAGRDKAIKIWDTVNGTIRLVGTIPTMASVGRVVWRPQREHHIASAALLVDCSINVWDKQRPFIPFAAFSEHTDVTTGIAWKGDPRVFLSTSKDSTLYLHRFEDAERPADRANPHGLCLSADGDLGIAVRQTPEAGGRPPRRPLSSSDSVSTAPGDFFFGDGEVNEMCLDYDDLDVAPDYTLPTEAFEPRHELADGSPPPESLQLWNVATEVVRLSPIPTVSCLNQMVLKLQCGRCGAALERTGWWCHKCHAPMEVISCHPTPSGRLHRDTRLLAGPPLPPPPASARAATLARVAGFVARLLVPAAPPPLLLAFVCLWALRRRRTAPRRLSAVSDAELERRARGVAVSDTQSTVVCLTLSPSSAGLESELRQLCLLLAPGGAPRPLVSLCGEPGSGLDRLVAAVASRLGLHLVPVDGPALLADSSGATASRVHQALSSASLGPGLCLVHLRDAHVLGRDRESSGPDARVVAALLEAAANLPDSAALLLSAPSADQLVHQLRAHVTHEVTLSAPDAEKRARMLRWLCRRHGVALDWISDRQVALQTAGYLLGDLEAVVTQAKCSALARLDEWCSHCEVSPPVRPPPLSLDSHDIQAGLGFVRARQAEVAGSPQIPDTRWQDVGGLGQVKREVVDLIQLPLARPELFAGAAARSGILLYGPPGTGKTLVAKAVATECRLNFLSVKGPELINMYVGQSEANVRDVFRRARDAAPAVVFFDELDSLAPNRGRTGDSGGVMDRVVSQFLSELDGAVTGGQVYVIGATNRPDLIDPALLRPGRFDRLLYLGASRDRASHTAILRAQTRRLPLAGDVSLEEVVSRLPEALTGADVYALCEQATRAALDRAVLSVEAGAVTEDSVPIEVRQSDLLSAADSLVPSLSPAQLAEYELLRTRIEGN
ncbi:Peroxisomal biogenesis factor 6 [Amphibalanus amphitrite]|uniref:Peroxisomal ATPase PEX6 n=1 Tax=Amphibalanus amphitrite TaxID=1232801 RepID=A0A6A4VY26_AMPAM|nr:Peroxisomal biogenesis factor 6 [Amphibalanus amphitrite]